MPSSVQLFLVAIRRSILLLPLILLGTCCLGPVALSQDAASFPAPCPNLVSVSAIPSDCSFAKTSFSAESSDDNLALNTDAVAPQRFVAAHGRQALIGGYASKGLEIWAYPFEILNNCRVSFRVAGTTTSIDGQSILRRVTYKADLITRVYLGPDFVVNETLFVPLNEPGAIITYSVQSQRPIDIDVHAAPIFNLMWPASLGGQSSSWNPDLSAFVLSDATSGFSASIGSPNILDHDDIGNRTTQGANGADLGFTLHPGSDGVANVYVALNTPGLHDPGMLLHKLVQERQALGAEYDAHIHKLLDAMLRVTTPDVRVNRMIAWSEIALDQAWVCNRDLGCGYVAGYGPARGARRPQYDWFFAGDGLIATDAATIAGNSIQAREELEFILHYQDKQTGMIWHEISQSAGFLDWAGKYPYMYVHVDITFQFLSTLGRYVAETGDVAFVRDNWKAIEAAYRYSNSLIDPATGLPHIPLNKEGGDEQDRMSEDLGLSVSWVTATAAFQQLANLTGHVAIADEAESANLRARASIPKRYWDPQRSFWINGYSESGRPLPEQRSSPSKAIDSHLFTNKQEDLLLDRLASESFQTDWGTRGVAAGSKNFDPSSYAKGSVSALGTAEVAMTFWSALRPVPAFSMWSSLLPWTSLDSLGHLHEVLAGNVYRPQEESVPEQTWSSAGFLEASVHGLLGLTVDALHRKITFAPHLPAAWHDVSLSHVPLLGTKISLTLHQTSTEIVLKIDNPGDPFQLNFAPSMFLGASVGQAELNHHVIRVTAEEHPQETLATVGFTAMHGASELDIALHGGVSVITDSPSFLLGDHSREVRMMDVRLVGDILTIAADVPGGHSPTIEIETEWKIVKATGAKIDSIAPNLSQITFNKVQDGTPDQYHPVQASFQLKH